MLTALLKGGILTLLTENLEEAQDTGSRSGTGAGAGADGHRAQTVGAVRRASRENKNRSSANNSNAPAVSTGTGGTGGTGGAKPEKGKGSRSSMIHGVVDETFPLSRLQDVFFLDLTLAGWVIRLGKPRVLQFLARQGYDLSLPVDIAGNSALHFIALHGAGGNSYSISSSAISSNCSVGPGVGSSKAAAKSSGYMVDIVLADKSILLEAQNPDGFTAGMLAAQSGNQVVAQRLFHFKASPRRCLDGCYAAWVLAAVRKAECNERNLQTGRYGDDDETYFDIAPDPFYITWYSP